MKLLMYPFVQAMICAWGFGGWSVMRQLFGVSMGWAMATITIVQACSTVFLWKVSPEMSSMRNVALFTLFGAIPNGLAIISIGYLLEQKGEVITTWVPVMNAMMLLIALFGGAILLGEALTLRKMVGVGAICFGIYVMSSQ